MRFFLSLILLISFVVAESPLSNRYHTYDEIQTQLFAWNDEYGSAPNSNYPSGGIMYELIEVGKSHQDELPFWAVKLTYNANENNDKPKILFLGQCHAEEILGVEITMALIDILLHPTPQSGTDNFMYPNGYRPSWGDLNSSNIMSILENSEVWVVPTHNPEGLSVVHGWDVEGTWMQDVTYRKNKHDLDGNDIFDFIVGQGNDSDGVDLNRNYDFNWAFGAGIYAADGAGCNSSYFTDFDYYRGPSAFSESEIRGIRDLALEQNFLVSVAYHSSRSGCLSEKVKYSWEWAGTKYPPDKDVLSNLGENIASLIGRVDAGTYEPSFSGSFKGVAHNWFYAKTGCLQYLIEVGEGQEGMQPNETEKINGIVHNNLRGAFYAINRTAGINNGNLSADSYMVSGLVIDGLTGLPIPGAEVKILEMDGTVLSPRLSDEYGRYRRLLIDESYTVQINALGYESQELSVTPSSNSITDFNIPLQPLQVNDLNINVTSLSVSSQIYLHLIHSNGMSDTLMLELGNQAIEYPIGSYLGRVYSEGKLPQFIVIEHNLTDQELEVDLKFESSIYSNSLENLTDWTIDSGTWVNEDWSINSQSDLKYLSNIDQSITLYKNIEFFANENYALKLELQYELEWDKDKLLISLKNENGLIIQKEISNQNWNSHYLYIPIPNGTERLSEITFQLITDGSVEYRGLILNNLSIMKSSDDEELSNQLMNVNSFNLNDNYPNPFNPSTEIDFQLGLLSQVSLKIYSLNGQLLETIIQNEILSAGRYSYIFNGYSLSSGIYFYELQVDGSRINKKMLLIK
jgi:hypothetical protein